VVQVLEDPPGHFQAVGCQVLPVPLAQLMGQRLCRVEIVGPRCGKAGKKIMLGKPGVFHSYS